MNFSFSIRTPVIDRTYFTNAIIESLTRISWMIVIRAIYLNFTMGQASLSMQIAFIILLIRIIM